MIEAVLKPALPIFRRGAILLLIGLFPCAHAETSDMRYLMSLTIEDLGKIKVTSVSKRSESIADAAASIYVITGDEIRRAGVTSLPQALRLAPNLQVAQVKAGEYGVSARGFNDQLGNKLLVLIDGRTVYSPVFSGVFWISQDLLMEDIERIEVISGPGGTLWGLNAVNGVINVITRSTPTTQGPLASASAGNNESGLTTRYGGKINEDTHYRVYAKKVEHDANQFSDGTTTANAFDRHQTGFRLDWDGVRDSVTLQGDAFQGSVEQTAAGVEPEFSGANVLARWTHSLALDSNFRIQTYYDYAKRENIGVLPDRMEIFDIELQHQLSEIAGHRLLWGGGYREADDQADNSNGIILFFPEQRDLRWSNIFIQDTIAITDSLDITPGVKWEDNIYTGIEFLPSIRSAWRPDQDRMVWAAYSRVVRAPARIDRDFYLTLIPGSNFFLIDGGRNFESEVSYVTELGYREQPNADVSYSVTAFYQEYEKLRSGEPNPTPQPFPSFVVSNTIYGHVKGIEAWLNYQAAPEWRLSAGLLELRKQLQNEAGSRDPEGPRVLGNDPKHTVTLRSLYNFGENYEFDVMYRYISQLPDPALDAYSTVDMRLASHLNDDVELSLTLQNAFDPHHPEFIGRSEPAEIQRSLILTLQWRPER